MLPKRDLAINSLSHWKNTLCCPHCQQGLTWSHNQLRCPNHHSFDLAKSGYLNLAPQHQEKHYTQDLFVSRYELMQTHQFYQGIYTVICQLIQQYSNLPSAALKVLDLGTGEGTHFAHFISEWQHQTDIAIYGMGLDLAKAGIQQAAKHYTNSLWTIADLSQLPFADESIDGALTILSPSHYRELLRVLKTDAWAIKVIPGRHYLEELRACVLPPEEVEVSHQNSRDRFRTYFDNVHQHNYSQSFQLTEASRQALLQMTPLMWHATPAQIAKAEQLTHIQIDLDILIGTKK